ncbi:drebrin-like protein [Chironomus tepperi]|uniref:drebrin-like protein n=1 Tax=Chironomus tepperi TaxID=113505 RepID=UPI00391F9BF4
MSVDLKKNKDQILDAWKKVTENEDGYDWALFGYEGKSTTLKVDAIGSGGIETVAEEINEGKIQYAFVRILDPNTHLVKFLLVNFQGEAVLDLVHKGTCSNHIRDISNLLKNQLTITASSIDDLDEDIIVSKLSKITSSYDFQNRAAPTDERIVIGTNYKKVVPTKEIDSVKRDEFWKQEEKIEKERVALETEARRLANLKLEEDRLKREQMEHAKREQMNKVLDAKQKTAPKPEKVEIHPVKPIIERDENARPKAEEMRTERRKEAQELIGNKVNAAKMMFQQQAAQTTAVKASAPAKPIRKTIPKHEPEIVPQIPQKEEEVEEIQESSHVTESYEQHEEPEHEISTIKRSPKTPTTPEQNNAFIENTTNGNKVEDVQIIPQIEPEPQPQPVVVQENVQEISQVYEHEQPEAVAEDLGDQSMMKAVALYDYQAVDDTEISFDPGDLITHIDQIDAGWWQGYSVRFGTYGLFPANYVQLVDDDVQVQ